MSHLLDKTGEETNVMQANFGNYHVRRNASDGPVGSRFDDPYKQRIISVSLAGHYALEPRTDKDVLSDIDKASFASNSGGFGGVVDREDEMDKIDRFLKRSDTSYKYSNVGSYQIWPYMTSDTTPGVISKFAATLFKISNPNLNLDDIHGKDAAASGSNATPAGLAALLAAGLPASANDPELVNSLKNKTSTGYLEDVKPKGPSDSLPAKEPHTKLKSPMGAKPAELLAGQEPLGDASSSGEHDASQKEGNAQDD